MGFFIGFIFALAQNTQTVAGYSRQELVLLFAVMNFIDIVAQMVWLRGLVSLQQLVRKGEFDLVLAKPISPLWWSAFRQFDFFDLLTFPLALWLLWYAMAGLELSPMMLVQGGVLMVLSLIIAFSTCVIICAATFFLVEMENAWWAYRDLVYTSRLPPEIYPKGVQWVFTFIIPVMVLVVFPVKAFLNRLTVLEYGWTITVTMVLGGAAALLWKKALKKYSSASS